MQQLLIIVLLLLLIGAAALTLFLDARQRRIDRQVATALSISQLENLALVRRTPVELQSRDLSIVWPITSPA